MGYFVILYCFWPLYLQFQNCTSFFLLIGKSSNVCVSTTLSHLILWTCYTRPYVSVSLCILTLRYGHREDVIGRRITHSHSPLIAQFCYTTNRWPVPRRHSSQTPCVKSFTVVMCNRTVDYELVNYTACTLPYFLVCMWLCVSPSHTDTTNV